MRHLSLYDSYLYATPISIRYQPLYNTYLYDSYHYATPISIRYQPLCNTYLYTVLVSILCLSLYDTYLYTTPISIRYQPLYNTYLYMTAISISVIPKVGRTPHRWASRKFCGAWRFFTSLPNFFSYLFEQVQRN